MPRRDPEKTREYARNFQAKLRADPELAEVLRARKRQWRNENRERELERQRKWRKNNRKKVAQYKKNYTAKHGDKERAYQRNRYRANNEKLRAQEQERRKKNRVVRMMRDRLDRALNPGKYAARNRKWLTDNPAKWRFLSVRKQAQVKGLAFDLDLEWFETRLRAGVCELSGLPFDLTSKLNLGSRAPNAASVDRIDPKGPYTKENCRMILWWINRMLANLGQEYVLHVFRCIFIKRGEIAEYEDRMAA